MWSSNHLLSIATILQNSYSIRIDSQPACRYKNIRPLISFTLIRLRAPLCDSASDCGIFGVCKRLRANAGAPQPFRPITLFYVQTRASVRFAADSKIGFPSQNAMNETHEYNLFEIIRMRWWWFRLNVNSRQQSNKRVERHSCYRKWRVRVCSFLSTVVVIFVSPVFVLCRRPPFRRW